MFNHQYFSAQYFPPVWFAEADDSHLLDEERHDYGGSAKRNRARADRFSSATEADIRRLIDEKWEAIDSAAAGAQSGSIVAVETPIQEPTDQAPAVVILPLIGVAHQSKTVSKAVIEAEGTETEEAIARRLKNSESLLLILSEA